MSTKILAKLTILFVTMLALGLVTAEAHQNNPGASSSASFSITLRVYPQVKEVARAVYENTTSSTKRCFASPGIDFISISTPDKSTPKYSITPSRNRFCLEKTMTESLKKYINKQQNPGNWPIIIAPD